ncbi:hypothetical protein ACGLWX_15520 [Halomonas sp. HMF6819]|uniref:hypothetical protein n=1 Tax=Halomonas sp. HMF6819 TaxID=3373085 RepID=UPI0037B54185
MSIIDSRTTSLRHIMAGGLILVGLLFQLLRLAGVPLDLSTVSYAFWLAMGLLWWDLGKRNRRQATVLAGAGFIFLVLAWFQYDTDIDWPHILDGNVYVVAMLVGVSFIGLIGSRQGHSPPSGNAITGRYGAASTLLGVHLLGAILNLSSVFIVGDRLSRYGNLTIPQLLALNRGLSSVALWSPFFASMGVVVTLAPDMQFRVILAFSLPLTLMAGVFTVFDLSHRFGLDNVPGFSLTPGSLLMPIIMASLVMLFHYGLTPELSIVSIITFLLPAVAVTYNAPQGVRWLVRRLRNHTIKRLPAMCGEISLFLCAGLFTQGLSAFINAATGNQWTLFTDFGPPQAAVSVLAIVASAVVGLHPIVGISVLASILELEGSRQTLFAFVALSSWAIGNSVGPLSGINLSLQGRYGMSGSVMMRNNFGYAGAMTGVVIVFIFIMDAVL